MKTPNSSLSHSLIIALVIALSPLPLVANTLRNHSAADSTVQVQFGLDSVKVDSILTHRLETARLLFKYSDNFSHANELRSKAGSYDAFCDTVSRILQLPKSSLKTPVYLYADSVEQLLCFKGWPPLHENQAFSGPNEIHANGLGAIQHEIVHILANNLIAYAKSVFFAEGIEQYVEIVRSDDMFRKDLRIAKKHLSEPWESWANDSIGFWATGEAESIVVAYPVSGLFVNYLIQRSGLETFKKFYRRIRLEVSTEVAFSIIYGYPLNEAIAEFKRTVASW